MKTFTLKAVRTMFACNASIMIVGIFLFAQTVPVRAEKPPGDWQVEVGKVDAAYWSAYNRADAKGLNSFLADDVEFYHDLSGMMIGKAVLSEVYNAMVKFKDRTRREAIAGTVRIFPMRKDDKIYGAIVSGEHQFHVTEKGKPESLVARAHFSHLLLLKGGEWKIARILSYDHVATKPAPKR